MGQHRCFRPNEATCSGTAQEPFWGGCQRGVGLCSPHSLPAIAHPRCKEKIRVCVLGKGRWRQRSSKPGTAQHRSPPVCFLETLRSGTASAGTFPFPVIPALARKLPLCRGEGCGLTLLLLSVLLRKTEVMPLLHLEGAL